MARGAAARGKRIAFGDGNKVIWGPFSEIIFRNNPNIATHGTEHRPDVEWIAHHKGHRLYSHHDRVNNRWIWHYDFRPTPGQLFFSAQEIAFAECVGSGSVLIEPNLPWHKPAAVNKDWGLANYQAVADRLMADGYDVVQFRAGRDRLKGVRVINDGTFREALAALARMRLAIVPEGGLHHGAAAVGTRAVVLFGAWAAPEVTGYPTHMNIARDGHACGTIGPCLHCKGAMKDISVEEVYVATRKFQEMEAAA